MSFRMLLHAQQLQAAVRVDWLFVKSTQLAAPALVSLHVAILVPVGIDLCRKREWDLAHDHFPLKSIHCEGLSVYHRWCEADSPLSGLSAWPCGNCSRVCSSRVGLYTYQLTHRWQGQSVRRLRRRSRSPCVYVCVCVRACVHACVCTLKEKQLDLSTTYLVNIYSMRVAWLALTGGQKVKSRGHMVNGYKNHYGCLAVSGCCGRCAAPASGGLHVIWLLSFLVSWL